MKKNEITIKKTLLIFIVAGICSCANVCPAPVSQSPHMKDRWRLFSEFGDSGQVLLIDTENLMKIEDGVTEHAFKCTAKMMPSPIKIGKFKDAIREGNKEAGRVSENGELFLKRWIERETKLHKCEISCKQDKFYFYLREHHIIEFAIPETGTERDFYKSVCK